MKTQRPLIDTLRSAAARRRGLFDEARTNAYRLLHGAADGLPEITCDRFAGLHVLSLYRELSRPEEQGLVDACRAAWAPAQLYLKRRPREARVAANVAKEALAPERPEIGEPIAHCDVVEEGLRFRVRPGQGLSVGLYLDTRPTRGWVRTHAPGRTVLNLFAYTCGFSVAALAGGAARVLNVDASRRVLDWGMENAALNSQPADRPDYVAGDVFDWLGRLRRKRERFGMVICDPPSFSTTRASRFSAAKDYPALAEAAAGVVAPGGLLVACCNLAGLSPERFEGQLRQGLVAAGRRGRVLSALAPSPLDFPPAPEGTSLKVRVLELL